MSTGVGESTRRLWRALGFPNVGSTTQVFTELDVEAVNWDVVSAPGGRVVSAGGIALRTTAPSSSSPGEQSGAGGRRRGIASGHA